MHLCLSRGLLCEVAVAGHNNVASGSWDEDHNWTAQMNEGWDAAKAKAVVDDLIATFGPQK